MNKRTRSHLAFAVALGMGIMGAAQAADGGATEEQAVAMVKKGIAFMKANG